MWTGARPVTSAVTCMPYTYIQFLRLPFQQSKLFSEKKKDHFLIHWVQEYVPVKASNRPAVELKYFTALVATLSSGTASTSDTWLLLNKDPSVWISEAWKPAQWSEIGFSGTTQKKNNSCNTQDKNRRYSSEESEDSLKAAALGARVVGRMVLRLHNRMKDHESWSLISTAQHISHNTVGNTSLHKSRKNN